MTMKKSFLQSLLVCIFLIPIAYSQEISEEFLKTLPPGVRSDVLNRIDDQEKITDPTYSSLQTQTKIEKKELEDETAEDDDFIRNIDDLMVFGSDFCGVLVVAAAIFLPPIVTIANQRSIVTAPPIPNKPGAKLC